MGQAQSQNEIYERRRRREECPGEEPAEPPRKRQQGSIPADDENDKAKEIIILNDDDDSSIRGSGTELNPFTFREWTTGNIIPETEDGNFFEISDDDDAEEGIGCSPRGRSPTPSPPSWLRREGLRRLIPESVEDSDEENSEGSISGPPFRSCSRTTSISSTTSSIHTTTDGSDLGCSVSVQTPEREEDHGGENGERSISGPPFRSRSPALSISSTTFSMETATNGSDLGCSVPVQTPEREEDDGGENGERSISGSPFRSQSRALSVSSTTSSMETATNGSDLGCSVSVQTPEREEDYGEEKRSISGPPFRSRSRALSVSFTTSSMETATNGSDLDYSVSVQIPEKKNDSVADSDIDDAPNGIPSSASSRHSDGVSESFSPSYRASIDSPSRCSYKYGLDDEEDEPNDDDGTSCYIVINDGKDDSSDAGLARISSQIPLWEDWKEDDHIKSEPDDAVPGLTLSQETNNAEDPETPGCSQSTIRSSAQLLQEPSSQVYRVVPPFELPKPSTAKPKKQTTEKARNYQEQREMTKLKKRLFYNTYAAKMETRLRQLTNKFVDGLAATKTEDECWIYAGSGWTGTSDKISVEVKFRHEGKPYRLRINIGFVSMVLQNLLTAEAKEGIIEEWWHASHLCGNWRCVNVRHIHPEPGPVNITRNGCFHGHVAVCPHEPPCRKHLTVQMESRNPLKRSNDLGKDAGLGEAALESPSPW